MTTQQQDSSGTTPVLPWVIATGAVAFAIGISSAFFLSRGSSSHNEPSPEMLAAAMAAQMVQMQQNNVTRDTGVDLLAISNTSPALAQTQDTAEIVPTPKPQLPTATANLNTNLNLDKLQTAERTQDEKIAEALAIANRNQLRMVTEGVVAGLYTVSNGGEAGDKNLGINSINAPTAVADLEKLLETAVENGDLKLPEAVATSSGSLDSRSLLFDLVQQSLAQGSDKEAAAAKELSKRAFQASTARSEVVGGKRFYVVESGDSLAYISLLFYGSTRSYNQIYSANRDTLASPDKIQVGQRLIIPNV